MNQSIKQEVANLRLRVERLDSMLVLEQIGFEEYVSSLKEIQNQLKEIEEEVYVYKKRKWKFWS